jgi:hypothetical protein
MNDDDAACVVVRRAAIFWKREQSGWDYRRFIIDNLHFGKCFSSC